jgi:polysaccharide export outer membrane protein
MKAWMKTIELFALVALMTVVAASCANNPPHVPPPPKQPAHYIIGAGDTLEIYVRNNKDLTTTVPVRPDGRISVPLVQTVQAAGKTPQQLANKIQNRLRDYIRQPIVTVIVKNFVGAYSQQVRVVGQAVTPKSIPYRKGMTLLDLMIATGGLTKFAAGNSAKVVRRVNGKEKTIPVNLGSLLNGNVKQNIRMRPGDILIIPESTF